VLMVRFLELRHRRPDNDRAAGSVVESCAGRRTALVRLGQTHVPQLPVVASGRRASRGVDHRPRSLQTAAGEVLGDGDRPGA